MWSNDDGEYYEARGVLYVTLTREFYVRQSKEGQVGGGRPSVRASKKQTRRPWKMLGLKAYVLVSHSESIVLFVAL
jgi:hypothetical protein